VRKKVGYINFHTSENQSGEIVSRSAGRSDTVVGSFLMKFWKRVVELTVGQFTGTFASIHESNMRLIESIVHNGKGKVTKQ
jgi:hypothetical protein